MIHVMVVTADQKTKSVLGKGFSALENVAVEWVASASEAFPLLMDKRFQLVISDERLGEMTGIEFVTKLVRINPFLNAALISSLSHEEFHEVTEGLGLLGQLPLKPDSSHLKDLLARLSSILGLSAARPGQK